MGSNSGVRHTNMSSISADKLGIIVQNRSLTSTYASPSKLAIPNGAYIQLYLGLN
jgi:hypothetical protein